MSVITESSIHWFSLCSPLHRVTARFPDVQVPSLISFISPTISRRFSHRMEYQSVITPHGHRDSLLKIPSITFWQLSTTNPWMVIDVNYRLLSSGICHLHLSQSTGWFKDSKSLKGLQLPRGHPSAQCSGRSPDVETICHFSERKIGPIKFLGVDQKFPGGNFAHITEPIRGIPFRYHPSFCPIEFDWCVIVVWNETHLCNRK
jgi:hypothetical protein